MKKISALSLLTITAAALMLSGCKKGSASENSSELATISVETSMIAISSSSKPAEQTQPPANTPDGSQSSEEPPLGTESSDPEDSGDRDDDAYYTYMSKGSGVMIMGGENEREKIKIPAAINERTVVAVSGSAKKTLFPNAKTIILPDTIEDIYNYAFAGCTYLTDINIPNGVNEIGEYAFKDCVSLQDLELPASVEEIEPHAFSGCQSLSRLTLSEGVRKIGEGAFSGCTSLTNITLPDSVVSVSYGAFDTDVDFTITCRGMTFNPYNINDLYTMFS